MFDFSQTQIIYQVKSKTFSHLGVWQGGTILGISQGLQEASGQWPQRNQMNLALWENRWNWLSANVDSSMACGCI